MTSRSGVLVVVMGVEAQPSGHDVPSRDRICRRRSPATAHGARRRVPAAAGPRSSASPHSSRTRLAELGGDRSTRHRDCARRNSLAWRMTRTVAAAMNGTSPRSTTTSLSSSATAPAIASDSSATVERSCSPCSRTTTQAVSRAGTPGGAGGERVTDMCGGTQPGWSGSRGLADVPAVGDVVRVRCAAEEDGSAWWAEPPARAGGRMQGWVAFEQQSATTALLRCEFPIGQGRCSCGFAEVGVGSADEGVWGEGHDASSDGGNSEEASGFERRAVRPDARGPNEATPPSGDALSAWAGQ